MNVTTALRWIVAMTCGTAIVVHAITAEAKFEKVKTPASKSEALTPGPSPATGEGSALRRRPLLAPHPLLSPQQEKLPSRSRGCRA